jgi:hydroxysqualene dehydroxylase
VILALTPGRTRHVAPEVLPVDPGLGVSPIVNVHLWYDRRVMDEPFVAVVDSPAQWIFNRTVMGHEPTAGHHLAVSISGARDEIDLTRDELARAMRQEVEHLFPHARAADLVRSAVVKEPEATFAQGPGQAARRPGARTPVPGVYLAGTWTATGWPATMESAVRSGLTAARLAVPA